MRRVLPITLFVLIWAACPRGAGSAPSWPSIKPEHQTYHFADAPKAKLKEVIYSEGGSPLYVLECYGYAVAQEGSDFDYSGDFECALHFYGTRGGYWTLLTELANADRDWESRGRFLTDQIVEPCGRYPDLGRERTFRLRGFKLTLNLIHVLFDNQKRSPLKDAPALKSFDLQVEVVPDPTATSAIAATPHLPPLNSVRPACRKAFDVLYLQQFRRAKPLY